MGISSGYSDHSTCVLILNDCIKAIKTLPSNSIDLTITSPPYFMGKEYDKSTKVEDFIQAHKTLLPEMLRVTKPGGSVCWQVGYHVKDKVVTPLDYLIHDIFNSSSELNLRNRIIWTFGHGLHDKNRFSGRHEMVLWYSKGKEHFFDLDSVRVPQKYPGKTAYKGEKKGEYSGNPLGKNPGDVWDIPNVKALHMEKTDHPCQFPVALAQRLIRALTPIHGRVFDPYMGSGSTGVAALVEGRKFVGMEIIKNYYEISRSRCLQALKSEAIYRPLEKPIFTPSKNSAVARKPSNFV